MTVDFNPQLLIDEPARAVTIFYCGGFDLLFYKALLGNSKVQKPDWSSPKWKDTSTWQGLEDKRMTM